MIQRKQSIYLLLITIMMSFLMVSPYAELTVKDGSSVTFNSLAINIHSPKDGSTVYRTTRAFFLLVLVTGILSLVNIFYFNYRIWQIRICFVSFILLLAILLLMFIYYSSARNDIVNIRHTFKIAGIYPILSILMNFLAYRAIHGDEILVNSYKRLR